MITIEAVKNALPLRAYLAEHGAEFVRDKSRCLFHEDRTPSASLYRGKDGYERFKCFGCGKDVDLIGAAQELHGLDFKGALKLLADRAGIKTSPQTQAERQAAEKARRDRDSKADAVRAFRNWEQGEVNQISGILRSYNKLITTKTTFTEAELVVLSKLQSNIDILEYYYGILCRSNDEQKFGLYREAMSDAGTL